MTCDSMKKTSHDYAVMMYGIQDKLEENEHNTSQLESRRAKVALAATQGDPAALEELDAIKADEALFAERDRNLRAAKDEALRLHKDAAELEKAGERRRRIKQSVEIADGTVAKCAQIDQALKALAPLLADRDHMLDELIALRIIEANQVHGLKHPLYANSALAASGVAQLLGLGAQSAAHGSMEDAARTNLRIPTADLRLLAESTP